MSYQDTYRYDNEDSRTAETNCNPKSNDQASIQDHIEYKVNVFISGLTEKTQETNGALNTNKDGGVEDKKLVQASENILFNVRDRSEVTAEDAPSSNTDQDAGSGQEPKDNLQAVSRSLKRFIHREG